MNTGTPTVGDTAPAVGSRSPDVLGGELVFASTRVPVRSLFDHVEAGDSLDDFLEGFLEGFPSVTRAQAIAVLEE